jgi:hypothetical protein
MSTVVYVTVAGIVVVDMLRGGFVGGIGTAVNAGSLLQQCSV